MDILSVVSVSQLPHICLVQLMVLANELSSNVVVYGTTIKRGLCVYSILQVMYDHTIVCNLSSIS